MIPFRIDLQAERDGASTALDELRRAARHADEALALCEKWAIPLAATSNCRCTTTS